MSINSKFQNFTTRLRWRTLHHNLKIELPSVEKQGNMSEGKIYTRTSDRFCTPEERSTSTLARR